MIPPVHLVRGGEPDRKKLQDIIAATANPLQMQGDLAAQLSANRAGGERLVELARSMGPDGYRTGLAAVNDYG